MSIYVNIVEEEISNIFNFTFNTYIGNNLFKNILKKNNNVKDLNKYLINLVEDIDTKIDTKKITKIINNENNLIKIKIIIKKYIIYYLCLIISYYIKEDEYKNILIKLQKTTVNNLFINNDDSLNIINQYLFLKNYLYVLNLYNNDKENFKKNILNDEKYNNIIKFINQEIDINNINILLGNDIKTYHNNIFFILIKNIYTKYDIKNIYNLLEDNNNIIYSTIDIVVPLISYIDDDIIAQILFGEEKTNSIIKDLNILLKKKKCIIR